MNRLRNRKRHPLYPEPGAWILDELYGMPTLAPPPLLPRKELIPSGRVRDRYISYEGLGFCVYEYIPPEMLADPKLRKLWTTARDALCEIVRYLETVPAAPEIDPTEERRIARPIRKRKSREEAEVKEEKDSPLEEEKTDVTLFTLGD